jgi:hypothetical protein
MVFGVLLLIASSDQLSFRRALIAGLLSGFAFLLRGNGLSLIAACAAAFYLRRNRVGNLAAFLVAILLIVLPAQFYSKKFSTAFDDRYAYSMTAKYAASTWLHNPIVSNLGRLPGTVARTLFQLPFNTNRFAALESRAPAAALAVDATVMLLTLAGLIHLLRSHRLKWPFAIHDASTFAIFVVWAWPIDSRFLMSVMPLLFLGWIAGAEWGAKRWIPALRHGGLYGGILLLLCNVAATADWAIHARASATVSASYRGRSAALAFFRNNTAPDAVVATSFPEMVYIYTERQGFAVISDHSGLAGQFGARPEFLAWLRAVGNRPVFAYSRCPGTDDEPAFVQNEPATVQVEALLRDPRFRITEVYRSPDCSSWVGTIRFVEDVRDDKNVAHPAN